MNWGRISVSVPVPYEKISLMSDSFWYFRDGPMYHTITASIPPKKIKRRNLRIIFTYNTGTSTNNSTKEFINSSARGPTSSAST